MKVILNTKNCIAFLLWIQLSVICGQQQLISPEVLEKKVKRYLSWMVDDSKPDIWVAASRLESLGREAAPLVKREVHTLPELAQVACVKVLIAIGEVDYGIDLLLNIIEHGTNQKARIDAIAMVGIYGDFDLEARLVSILENVFNPYIKIALNKALWQVARNPQATRLLKTYLNSENFEIKFAAALALGEINNVQAAKPVLAKLKNEPSPRGRLARVLLEQEARINRYEALLATQGAAKPASTPSKYPVFEEVLEKIQEYHVNGDKLQAAQLIDAAIKGMVADTDPHSAFWTESEWEDFVRNTIQEAYVGIGVYVSEHNGHFTVIAPIYSGPAYRAGIRSMDRIVEVDGWETFGRSSEDIIKKIRGKQTSTVTLKIYREGWSKMRDFVIKREKITIPTVFPQMLPRKIGYIRLTQFGRKATENIEKALTNLEKQNMQALILDLRGNAGGWLQTAVDILDKFIDGGKLLVYSKGRHAIKGKKYEYFSTKSATHFALPMVVLVDESSASASEIVAGTLQVYKRAILVGKRTYGKGSVQEPLILDARPGTRLKLTIAKYYLPDGRCIHNIFDRKGKIVKHNGVKPDIEVDYENGHPWKNEEYATIEEQDGFDKYLNRYYLPNKNLFEQLAENDGYKYEKYPDFEVWYTSLKTKASKQDVRGWLRKSVRNRVADDIGKNYACDYLEDVMLQRALVELCQKLQIPIYNIPEFRIFAKKFRKK